MSHSTFAVDSGSSRLALAREGVQSLGLSKIREVANAGMGRADVLPFWFGEPDEVTPAFIREAAKAALDAGDTFYTQNFGIPALRQAVAQYLDQLHPNGAHTNAQRVAEKSSSMPENTHGKGVSSISPTQPRIQAHHVAITGSGVSALMLVAQALLAPGDRVVAVTPLWPNLTEIPRILSAEVTRVPLHFSRDHGWQLDVQALLDALQPINGKVPRYVVINSPNNPTGWTMRRDDQQAVLDHCRKHGIWVVADDAYERLYFASDVPAAPSFLDIGSPDERIVSTNTFSKSWLMTGWRLGWIVGAPSLLADIGKLIEYNTSCAPGFVQQAGVAAVTQGDPVIARTRARFMHARDTLNGLLNAIPGVQAVPAPGAMYAFFKIAGLTDSVALCKRLVGEFGLGIAPGAAFGAEGEGYVRWCFAASDEKLVEGAARLRRGLAAAG
jgi:aspartate/methionine/tyrosine aminotransferase